MFLMTYLSNDLCHVVCNKKKKKVHTHCLDAVGFIDKFEEGLDTTIGQVGIHMSGGET